MKRDERMADLKQDIRDHVQEEIDDNLSRGMSPEESRRAALITFGNVTQVTEATREVWGFAWLDRLLGDLQYALRMLWKTPGFTVVAVLSLALGIGANTAVFSVVYSALLQPLPFRDASRLMVLNERAPNAGIVSVAYPDFVDWHAQSHSFSEMAALQPVAFNLSGLTEPEFVNGLAVSPNFLAMLGIRPAIGRDFEPQEEKPGTAPVVMLSDSLWQRRFGRDSGAVGKTVILDGRPFTIVGVLPADFRAPGKTDVLVPLGVWTTNNAAEVHERGDRGDMIAVGRLADGVSRTQATSEMQGIAARLAMEYRATNDLVGAVVQPIRDALVGQVRPALLLLLGAVILVLLIACANVANLLLVRGAGRTDEMALRFALGASRSRVFAQILTESLVLSSLGGLIGLGIAFAGVRAARLIPAALQPAGGVALNVPVLVFSAGVVVIAALLFGITPAIHANRHDLQSALKEGRRSSDAAARHSRTRNTLATAEAALAVVLLAGAGLMVKSLYRLLQVDPGFRPDRVLTMTLSLRPDRYSKDADVRNFWDQVLQRARALPGVESAAVATNAPMTGNHDRVDITIEGMAQLRPGDYPHPDTHVVSPGYVQTLGIDLRRGRTFAEDDSEQASAVAMINQRLATQWFPNQDPIGKRFIFGHPSPKEPAQWRTIVGVVADTKLYGLANQSRLEIYVPFRQAPAGQMDLLVESRIEPSALTSGLRGAVYAVDSTQSIAGVATMNELVSNSIATPRMLLLLMGLFSALAVVLAAIGIYGVIAYSVAQRTREIGIRMALGARRSNVFGMVIGQGVKLAVAGIAIGIPAALGLARLMSSQLYQVSTTDAETSSAVVMLVLLVALAASFVPARRATTVEPMEALR
ncbi:MAG TPA: ABC transporter permease [Vicinamibacterales bacterium]